MESRELQQKVVGWAQSKGLLNNVDDQRVVNQTLKVIEELGETCGALLKGREDELVDGIGDTAVTLIILGAMNGHEIDEQDFVKDDQHVLLSTIESLTFYTQDHDPVYLSHAYRHLREFAESHNYSLEDCLESAYNIIAKRSGNMVNGTFIKDENSI